MSYRTFKHLLGETSLERKCRFIFGGGILILVTMSFYWYGRKTESLVIGRNTEAARMLVGPVLMQIHVKPEQGPYVASLADELIGVASRDTMPQFEFRIISTQDDSPAKQPKDAFEREAFDAFFRAAKNEEAFLKTGSPRRSLMFRDGTQMFATRTLPGKYQYLQAVQYNPRCLLTCHSTPRKSEDGKYMFNKANDLAGMVVIEMPMDQVKKAIHQNRAILISAALVTAILAMVASYVIVRYVIVKPVKHLRDVSDAIAAGKLTIRSQIHTGDEFEELSHAFNRMLHNLVVMQQELRDVNKDLDRKVDELAQANLALFEMNRLKSDFLATMSHELRTPLNSIIGFSEVLTGTEQLSERHRRYASNILNSGRMLLSMINDILDLAKIESGKMEVRVEDFSLEDLCESLANLMRPMAERKNIDLDCMFYEGMPVVRQDPGKLRQIIYNLLSNAIKFTPEGGRVTLRTALEGKLILIQVEDTGIGIASEDQEKIFEKFRQVSGHSQGDGVLTREHQGTGLGLSIVRELCKLLGGDVVLKSEPGLGSTFTVRLPRQTAANLPYQVNVVDHSIDLSKARRVDPRSLSEPHGSDLPGAPISLNSRRLLTLGGSEDPAKASLGSGTRSNLVGQ